MGKLTRQIAWPFLGIWMFCFGVDYCSVQMQGSLCFATYRRMGPMCAPVIPIGCINILLRAGMSLYWKCSEKRSCAL